jgi:hypothetical protein
VLPGALDDDCSSDRHLAQLHSKAGSSECDGEPNCIEPIPERGATVRLDHLLGQSESRVTIRGDFASHVSYLTFVAERSRLGLNGSALTSSTPATASGMVQARHIATAVWHRSTKSVTAESPTTACVTALRKTPLQLIAPSPPLAARLHDATPSLNIISLITQRI